MGQVRTTDTKTDDELSTIYGVRCNRFWKYEFQPGCTDSRHLIYSFLFKGTGKYTLKAQAFVAIFVTGCV